VVACKLEDEEGGGDKVRIACIDIQKIFVLSLDTEIKDSNYGASSLKRGMFQHAIVQQTLKCIPRTCNNRQSQFSLGRL
jgi:hypothetical protein